MLHDRMRPFFRMCAIIAASHLHHSRFLLSPRLRSHSDPITPINTHSIRIVFEDINVDAKVKRATLNGRALISFLIGLISVSDMGDHNALCSKSNGSYDIKDFGTLALIFSTSKYFRRKCQPCPSFFSHPNIPDKWKRAQLSLDQMKKKERVKVKS